MTTSVPSGSAVGVADAESDEETDRTVVVPTVALVSVAIVAEELSIAIVGLKDIESAVVTNT
jgi:hypothetical protein